jgi:hypothetical protein
MASEIVNFEELLTRLIEATGKVDTRYFEVQTASKHGPSVVHRERVYCYELYHQLRNAMGDTSPYTLMGELDKSGHDIIASAVGEKVPDFVFHAPGGMEANLAVMEVKHIDNNREGRIREDCEKLRKFVDERRGKYKGAIYLVFGTGEGEIAKFHKIVTQESARVTNGILVLLWHKRAGERAEKLWRLPHPG